MQRAPITVCTSTTRRLTNDDAMTTGAAPTSSAFRRNRIPSPLEKSANQMPRAATSPIATTTSAIRHSFPVASDAASAASSVAPWRTTATNGTQCPVGPDARNT